MMITTVAHHHRTESNREIQRQRCDDHEERTERNWMLGGPEAPCV